MVEPAIDMDDSPTGERVIEDLIGGRENQWFDRKRFAVTDKALADALIGFANADGGTLIVGVDDDGLISGVDITSDHLNELQQAAVTFSEPPVRC